MIDGLELKKLRELYSLTQSQLANAVCVDVSTISNYELNKRTKDIEILRKIFKVYGMKMETKIIVDDSTRRDYRFFQPKNYTEFKKMSEDEITDYIIATQGKHVLCRICNVDVEVVERIPVDLLRTMVYRGVSSSIRFSNNGYLELYFKLTLEHHYLEAEASSFIHNFICSLKNLGLDERTMSQVYYIDITDSDVEHLDSSCTMMGNGKWYKQIRYTIKNFFLLNKQKERIKEIPIIDNLENFKFEVYGDLGHYLKSLKNRNENILQIKYD